MGDDANFDDVIENPQRNQAQQTVVVVVVQQLATFE